MPHRTVMRTSMYSLAPIFVIGSAARKAHTSPLTRAVMRLDANSGELDDDEA